MRRFKAAGSAVVGGAASNHLIQVPWDSI